MVVGTGIDVIEVDRIAHAARRGAFLKRIFTPREQAYYRQCGCSAQTLAGMFAAKEATVKALAASFSGIGWREIEILLDSAGAPYAKLGSTAEKRMQALGGTTIRLSIALINSLAVAQAILEA